jgi:spore germination cell wall hydrolase CwlJ-like protein
VDWVRVARRTVAICQNLTALAPAAAPVKGLSALAPAAKMSRRDRRPGRIIRQKFDRSHLAPAFIGLALWVGFPTTVALQDMTSMITGADANSSRWNAYVQKSVAGSVQAADMPFADKSVRAGVVSGAGMAVPGIGKVAFREKAARESTSDEERVVRSDKGDRLLQMAPVAPPKAFTAGSVFDRTSSLMRPAFDMHEKLVFAKPAIQGREIQIAAAFHATEENRIDPAVPSYLAELVNNDTADILATAYAPAEPDYAKASPFESLLNEEPNGGRFVPPRGKGDHAWISQPLPEIVFSAKEQQCLANAIYFEARGESTRGQAAVAQVVLNRVRNPTYPKTICGVVYQNDSWFNRCQFSFACDGKPDLITSPSHYAKAREIALAVTAGKIFIPEVGSSTHYYAQYVSPGWARAMNKMTKIGLHIFYRTKNGGWS